MSAFRAGKFFAVKAMRPARKYFKKHKLMAGTVGLTLPGLVQTTVTHPFEHAQAGRGGLPKYIKVKDANGKMIKQKNPARYGKIKIPKLKPIVYDRGDATQHYLARVPKGMINSVAILGTVKGMKRFGIPKL